MGAQGGPKKGGCIQLFIFLWIVSSGYLLPTTLGGGRAREGGRKFTKFTIFLYIHEIQEGTNVHFSNVHFVLCQNFGLNRPTPPFHAFFPRTPLY